MPAHRIRDNATVPLPILRGLKAGEISQSPVAVLRRYLQATLGGTDRPRRTYPNAQDCGDIMRNIDPNATSDETVQFIVELANGQTIRAHAGPSGLPVILCDDLPADLPAFTERCPPTAGQFAPHWDSGVDESHRLQKAGK
ncbi:hypothetical protein [Rosistilla oblonga]|nr:hypothetical protein [Rosistilla oblonga]